MRWSQLHIPTLREDPADADAASHRLLLRAGFIRQLMAGHYSLLPLGMRVRAKVINVIREEMNRIGAQEFLMPCMQPAQLWEKTGRLAVMGEETVPAHRPQGRGTRPGHDARGGRDHARDRAFLLPAAAPVLVPHPDQVPRRAEAEKRPDPGPRVHDEGLLQLRHRRGRARCLVRGAPRRVPADLRPARHPGHRGRGVQRDHGRQRLGRVRVPVGRGRGPGRAVRRR